MPRRLIPKCRLCGKSQARLILTGAGAFVCIDHARELADAVAQEAAASLPSPGHARALCATLGDRADRLHVLSAGGDLATLSEALGARVAVEFEPALGRLTLAAL